MIDQPHLPQDPDILMAATLFLMTQYAVQRRRVIADAIVHHIEQLRRCESDLPPRLQRALPRLQQQWSERFCSTGADHGQPTDDSRRGQGVVVPFRARAPHR
jgi:hypothetical protein